jgi:hypothetical protein
MIFSQQKSVARSSRHRKALLPGLLAISLLISASAFAVGPKGSTNDDLEARYQREKASCTNGQSSEDRATCLREAAAAYQEEKQGKLGSQPTTTYHQNALARCKLMPVADQPDCRRRINNPSDIEGNVESGGMLRKDVTIIPAPAR